MNAITYQMIENLFLVFIRVSGFFILSPIFGRKNIPALLKSALVLLITIIIYYSLDQSYFSPLTGYGYLLAIALEFLIGISIGYITFLVFSVFYIAGQIIDMNVGFGIVNVLDPNHNIQVPIFGSFYYNIALLLFLMMDGHHNLIRLLNDSFRILSPGNLEFSVTVLPNIISMFVNIFVMGFKIALPIIGIILVTDVLLGILAKTVPQINVFVVGMPLKILIGLAIIMACLPQLVRITEVINSTMVNYITNFLNSLSRG